MIPIQATQLFLCDAFISVSVLNMQESVSYASSLLSVRRSFLENQDEDSFMFKQRGGELGRSAQSVCDTATHDPESRHGEKN